ncbi:unnamed protein product [Gordionus sp. m RMFG-2023]
MHRNPKNLSAVTSKAANTRKCNDILEEKEYEQRIYVSILSKDSCKLQCKIRCKYYVNDNQISACKNLTTDPDFDEYLENEFVVFGTRLSNNTICLNNEPHRLSKDGTKFTPIQQELVEDKELQAKTDIVTFSKPQNPNNVLILAKDKGVVIENEDSKIPTKKSVGAKHMGIGWRFHGNCMGFEIPFQAKKCTEISPNSGVCSGESDIFVPCKKKKSKVTSKEANDRECTAILGKIEQRKRTYRYILNADSCKLQCRIRCIFYGLNQFWECKNRTIEHKYDEYMENKFVVNGTQLTNNTICINNKLHILSKSMREATAKAMKVDMEAIKANKIEKQKPTMSHKS